MASVTKPSSPCKSDSISNSVHENEDNVNDEEQSKFVEPKSKKARSKTPECWKFFTDIGICDDGKQRVKCNGCGTRLVSGGSVYGSSHLKRHAGRCKKIRSQDISQVMLDMQGQLRARKIDNNMVRELVMDLVIKHDLPLKFVEYKEFWDLATYLNPDVNRMSRNTGKSVIQQRYSREKAMLKTELAKIPNRISLTSDLWTSCTTEGYISLTAHFVDLNWKLNSKILNFQHMPPPHTGFELATKINEFLHNWGIEKKIFCVTLDNALANDVLQKTLKSQLVLQKGLICDGKFFHVRCCAHILNVIVQKGLKVAGDALDKIKESIKYVKGSESRMIKFKQCIEKLGDLKTSSGLCLDVPTRWNSTYLMLQSALKYQRVFEVLHLDDESYKYCPSVEEWTRARKMCNFLLPFYEITTLISGTSYPTSNLYFLQVWKIQCILLESTQDEDDNIKIMAENMMVKFDKYWDEYSEVLAFGAILDPRMKVETLGICYEKIDPLTCQQKVTNIVEKLNMLFIHYSSRDSTVNAPIGNNTQSSPSTASTPNLFHEIKVRKRQVANNTGRTQLDTYLAEATLDFDFTEHMDVLEWWKGNSTRFPNLSLMARDLLSIPITTVASESAFSIGSRVLNKYRNRLSSENVKATICTRNWDNGFNEDEDNVNDGKVEVASSSKGASNVIEVQDD